MTVKELMEILSKLDSNLKVRVYADHGQSAEPACSASVDRYVDDRILHEDDYDDYDQYSVGVTIY